MTPPNSGLAVDMAHTPREAIDEVMATLVSHAQEWADLDLPARRHYLRACLEDLRIVAHEWVSTAARIKGVGHRDDLVGEEWLSGPTALARNLRLLLDALENDALPPPVAIERRGQQHVARIFPGNWRERLLFRGCNVDVWIEPGRPPSQGQFYRQRTRRGRLTVVLGAGNATSISLMDSLHKLFVEGSVVVLKMHPLLAPLGATFERAFRSLGQAGYFAVVYGGADTGAALVAHPAVDAVHLTGSAETYNRIVWGADPAEQRRAMRSGVPASRPVLTSELGCVTPVIVTPGRWTNRELDYQARHVASMLVHNAGHNCTTAQVIITSNAWPQRREFVARLKDVLTTTPPRVAFYPGARQRHDALVARYATAWSPDAHAAGAVPWTVVEGCDPRGDAFAFSRELFCGACVEVPLGAGAADFLDAAVAFANERCWGTLSAVLIIDEATRAREHEGLDRAIQSLRYGVVGVNVWSAVAFGLASPPWGSAPGNRPTDIQSGLGFVHNTYLFDHPAKAVITAPFVMSPTPAWFADHPNLLHLGSSLFEHERHPTLGALARLAWAGIT